MVLVLFAGLGFLVGYRLEMTRAGYITMALTSVGCSAGQIIHLFMTRNREVMTLLPLVIGLIVVMFMLLGALIRRACSTRASIETSAPQKRRA